MQSNRVPRVRRGFCAFASPTAGAIYPRVDSRRFSRSLPLLCLPLAVRSVFPKVHVDLARRSFTLRFSELPPLLAAARRDQPLLKEVLQRTRSFKGLKGRTWAWDTTPSRNDLNLSLGRLFKEHLRRSPCPMDRCSLANFSVLADFTIQLMRDDVAHRRG